MQAQLSHLPSEIIHYIIEDLDFKVLCCLRLTNRRLDGFARGYLLKIAKEIAFPIQEYYDMANVKLIPDNTVSHEYEGFVDIPHRLREGHDRDLEVFADLVNGGAYHSVKLFLDAGVFANAFDLCGRTMLHLCVRNGDVELANLLLDRGADPYRTMRYGFSPMHFLRFAPPKSQEALAWLLLDKGYKVPDNVGWLFRSICQASCALKLIRYMVEEDLIDINKSMDLKGKRCTALHIAAEFANSTDILEYLLSVKPSLLNKYGTSLQRTAYGYECVESRPSNAVYLLNKGINSLPEDVEPTVAAIIRLESAVSLNRLDVIRALLARGELWGWGDETWEHNVVLQLEPLESAIENQYLTAMELLLENRQFPYDQVLIDKCEKLASAWGCLEGSRLLQAKQILQKLKQAMGVQ
ncbi:ankyrin [Aspergillus neoniger CBS 115656]|uniref:Ankyrin n=1 Tax=Aspergillus neoniger (strain CBS 115656) TaxID=1448310 RepID=A0A318ZPK5_ASPNB|nr:ankyrin [Aspergillus neoniger CBS 115656]PYH37762.1 ankyrin [Aspergillus neoniger CBS 115656]